MSDSNTTNDPQVLEITDAVLSTWATEPSGPVALTLKQRLLPVEASGIIFPPTYADVGYSIDILADGTRIATIDSVGSQANRLEPIFKTTGGNRDEWLVPQIEIVIRREDCGQCDSCLSPQEGDKKKAKCKSPIDVKRSILDLAHRAADAVVQSSPTLRRRIAEAFHALRYRGDAGPLCEIAPTSLVFGVWDSRGESGEKRPRLVRSVIRARNVETLHGAAQFNSVWKALDDEQQKELEDEARKRKTKLSEKGFADAPAVFRKVGASAGKYVQEFRDGAPNPERRVLGGVLANGPIDREVTVNLVALRSLRGTLPDPKDPKKRVEASDEIRKYLLGLTLVAATADIDLFLREGCLLRYADDGDRWHQMPRRGRPIPLTWAPGLPRSYANEAAKAFRSHWSMDAKDLCHDFNLAEAKKLLAKKSAEDETAKD